MSKRSIRKRRHHRAHVLGVTRDGAIVWATRGGTPVDERGFVRRDYHVKGHFYGQPIDFTGGVDFSFRGTWRQAAGQFVRTVELTLRTDPVQASAPEGAPTGPRTPDLDTPSPR
jgi:hypothetical protein